MMNLPTRRMIGRLRLPLQFARTPGGLEIAAPEGQSPESLGERGKVD